MSHAQTSREENEMIRSIGAAKRNKGRFDSVQYLRKPTFLRLDSICLPNTEDSIQLTNNGFEPMHKYSGFGGNTTAFDFRLD